MRVFLMLLLSAGVALGVPSGAREADTSAPAVQLLGVPDGGIQPQAVMDDQDVLHVLYFKGPPAGGDLYYVRRSHGAQAFTSPVRVNSVPGTALATGSVRGGQLALGDHGRAHVAWYGAKELDVAGAKHRPVWYARLASDGTHFDPQVDVAAFSKNIDGATVAADRTGNVYVAWHGQGAQDGEAHRTVYVARSRDAGAHFAREEAATQASTGACGCCGLRAAIDATGAANILYRAATGGTHRDAAWLTLGGTASTPVVLQTWELNACPMSTFALEQSGSGLGAAWETEQQIYYSRLDPKTHAFSPPLAMEGPAGRKHPAIATNAAGVTLVAWTEGTAWARGGTLAWEALDKDRRRLAAQSKAAPVPVWGLVAAAAWRDGSFVVLH